MEIEIHQAHLEGGGHDLPTTEGFFFQKLLGFPVQVVILRVGQIALGRQQKAAAAAARVSDSLHGLWANTLHHCLDQRSWGKILARSAFHVLGVLLQQAFIDFTLDIGGHGHPFFLVNHLDDAVQNGGVVDLVGSTLENLAQGAALLAKGFQDGFILLLQLYTLKVAHVCPVTAGRNTSLSLVRRLCVLVGHFQKDQVGELLQVVAVGHAVIPQRPAHPPDLGDDGCGLFRHYFSSSFFIDAVIFIFPFRDNRFRGIANSFYFFNYTPFKFPFCSVCHL